jgi:hypothetical protein
MLSKNDEVRVPNENEHDVHKSNMGKDFKKEKEEKLVNLIATILINSAIRKYEQQKRHYLPSHFNRPSKQL